MRPFAVPERSGHEAVADRDYAEICRASTRREVAVGGLFPSRVDGLGDAHISVTDLDGTFADAVVGEQAVFRLRREGGVWLVDERLDRALALS